MLQDKKHIRLGIGISLATFLLGLLFGWLVLGWQVWPVQWTGVLPADLGPTDRDQYLDLVAESYTLNKDAALAQQRIASFPAVEQASLLADVKTRVARRLNETENILVMGADQRPGWEAWRTDSLMVVAIDHKGQQVGIISIPRDLYVDIPGYGKERINAVDYIGEKTKYPGGGPALAARVVSETLGIPTQHYARIEMEGLVRLIDALGGVTVTLDCPLYERTPNDSAPKGYVEWTLPAGQVHLDGDMARKFATFRYVTTDFGRTQRQQQLIWAIRNRAFQFDVISRIPELWKALSDVFTTDFSVLDVIRLARMGMALKPGNVHGLVLGPTVVKDLVTSEGAWVLTISDPAKLALEKEQLFFRKSLAQLGENEAAKQGKCPPPPAP